MEPRVQRELTTIVVVGCIVLGIAAYSVNFSRAQVRDDLRKQDITNLKRSLEQYNNVHESYVSSPTTEKECTQSSSGSWFFGDTSPILNEQFIDAIPHDVREHKGHVYTYCVTSTNDKQATGFYLQAILEADIEEGVYFDEDEKRKFGYRILREDNKLLYRVCGGEDVQCKPQSL